MCEMFIDRISLDNTHEIRYLSTNIGAHYSCSLRRTFMDSSMNTGLPIYCVRCVRAAYREADIVYRVQYRMVCIAIHGCIGRALGNITPT